MAPTKSAAMLERLAQVVQQELVVAAVALALEMGFAAVIPSLLPLMAGAEMTAAVAVELVEEAEAAEVWEVRRRGMVGQRRKCCWLCAAETTQAHAACEACADDGPETCAACFRRGETDEESLPAPRLNAVSAASRSEAMALQQQQPKEGAHTGACWTVRAGVVCAVVAAETHYPAPSAQATPPRAHSAC